MIDFDSKLAGSILTANIPSEPSLAAGERDSETIAYVLAVRPPFDQLRHAAAQLAAFSVLATTGSKASGPDHPLLAAARMATEEAMEGIRLAPAVTVPAQHHHHHLLRAAASVEAALATLGGVAWMRDTAALDTALRRLKAGWQELHWATAALPGFEMVGLAQSCCAGHSRAMARPDPL